MKEYRTREEAEQDPKLNLKIVWACNKCGEEKEEYPHQNEDGFCSCGGQFIQTGESYNA